MTLSIASCTGSMQNDDGNSVLALDESVEEESKEVSKDEDEFESSETEESEDFTSFEINSTEEISNIESELTFSNENTVMKKTSRNKSRDSSRGSKIEKEKVFHTVMFKNGNTVLKTQKVQHGESAVAPKEPKKEGTFFTNWDKKIDNVKKDITVKAEWLSKEQMNKIQYNENAKYNPTRSQFIDKVVKLMSNVKKDALFDVFITVRGLSDYDKIVEKEIGLLPEGSETLTHEEVDDYIAKRLEIIGRENTILRNNFIKKHNMDMKRMENGFEGKPTISLNITYKATKNEIIAFTKDKKLSDIIFIEIYKI